MPETQTAQKKSRTPRRIILIIAILIFIAAAFILSLYQQDMRRDNVLRNPGSSEPITSSDTQETVPVQLSDEFDRRVLVVSDEYGLGLYSLETREVQPLFPRLSEYFSTIYHASTSPNQAYMLVVGSDAQSDSFRYALINRPKKQMTHFTNTALQRWIDEGYSMRDVLLENNGASIFIAFESSVPESVIVRLELESFSVAELARIPQASVDLQYYSAHGRYIVYNKLVEGGDLAIVHYAGTDRLEELPRVDTTNYFGTGAMYATYDPDELIVRSFADPLTILSTTQFPERTLEPHITWSPTDRYAAVMHTGVSGNHRVSIVDVAQSEIISDTDITQAVQMFFSPDEVELLIIDAVPDANNAIASRRVRILTVLNGAITELPAVSNSTGRFIVWL